MRKLPLLSVVFGLVVAFSSPTFAAEAILKIGAPQPMTGPDAPFGDKFKKAYSHGSRGDQRRAAA